MAQGKLVAGIGVTRTPLGRMLVAQSPRGIVRVAFLDTEKRLGVLRALRRKFVLVNDPGFAARIGREIKGFLKGELPDLEAHPVDLSLVKGRFQRRVLECLRQVPPGAATTYGALAAAAGEPRAQRAVGNAMARNPVPIYVPCHRVMRRDGSIGNYAAGIARKAMLLRAEGFGISRGGDRLSPPIVIGRRGARLYCRPQCPARTPAQQAWMLIFASPSQAGRAGMRACPRCRPDL